MKNKEINIAHEFVEFIPNVIQDRTLYISIKYCTAIHKCICGCGNEVVTPLSPTDWELTFNGKTISLSPSIGNWSFECKSHYFITRSKIVYARNWKDWEIEDGRKADTKKRKAISNEKLKEPLNFYKILF